MTALVLILGGDAVDAGTGELDAVKQLAAEDRTEEALQLLEAVIAEGSSEPQGLLIKGVLLVRLERTTEAKMVFVEMIRRWPELPEAYNNLAAVYAAAGDSERAIALLKAALGTHESYETVYGNLRQLYAKMAGEAYASALGGALDLGNEPRGLTLLDRIGSGAPSSAPVVGARRRYSCWW